MNKSNKNSALLPSGFEDVLFPDAAQEARAVEALMSVFDGFGYERVNPPLLEFEESLLGNGPGVTLSADTFRLMDPDSHRMMALRSDITAQIARIASSRLAKQPRPLRLSYAGNVLRTRGSQQRTERQFTQVGCEVIGRADDEADIEICVLPLLALAKLGITKVTLDLNLPGLLSQVFEDYKIAAGDVKDALVKRDVEALKAVGGPGAEMLISLLSIAGPAETALKTLDGIEFSDAAAVHIETLKIVYSGVKRALDELGLPDVSVTIDPAENKGFEYHNGIGFVLFSGAANGEIGRGGRYDAALGKDGTESATGFTLYMDTVRKAMPKFEDKKRVLLDFDTPWSKLLELQEQGTITVRGSQTKEDE